MNAEQLENLQAVIDNYGEPDDTIIVDNTLFNDNKSIYLYDIVATANLEAILSDKAENIIGQTSIPDILTCDGVIYVKREYVSAY